MFTACLDTCVLWPSLQRDFLLSLAAEQLYRPVWSNTILEELEFHEALKLRKMGIPDATAQHRAHNLVSVMRAAFVDAETTGWEPLEGTYGLPDQDDEHVVAAAVIAGAGAIVTENFKDFPLDKIPPGIQILRARDFARDTVALGPARARRAVAEIALRSGKKSRQRTEEEILEVLVSRYEMGEAVEILRDST